MFSTNNPDDLRLTHGIGVGSGLYSLEAGINCNLELTDVQTTYPDISRKIRATASLNMKCMIK